MNINIGTKYLIETDKYNYILRERKVYEKGENVGQEYLVTLSYHSNLDQLISKLINYEIMTKQEADSLNNLVKQSIAAIMEQLT